VSTLQRTSAALPRPPVVRALELIGWRESVRLPELKAGMLEAKVDTGARSAALHADEILVHGRRVSFRLGGRLHDMPFSGQRRVKNSGGRTETRVVIETEIKIGRHRFATEVTLTDRADMGVPMLIGRATIRGRFLVHPGRAFIQSKKAP
jgi:hypothetical protein